MLSQDQIQALRAPFPPEALSPDFSHGFELTSIRAAFVIERLNDVFGPCGIGWRYVHGAFEEVPTQDGRDEIVTEVAFQYRYDVTDACAGCDRIVWDAWANDWAFRSSNGDWSEPIFASGGKSVTKGGAAHTDARKSAVTDGLTKAASMLGVGHEVFKGLVRLTSDNGSKPSPTPAEPRDSKPEPTPDNNKPPKPNATMFWTLYHGQAKAADVPIETAKDLASKGDWEAAIAELRTLCNGAKA